jgi:hypothetical protein
VLGEVEERGEGISRIKEEVLKMTKVVDNGAKLTFVYLSIVSLLLITLVP